MNINKWNAPSRKISCPDLWWRWHIHITHLMPNQLCLYLYLCQLSRSFLPGFAEGDKGGQVQLHDIWFIRIYVDTDDFCITWCLYLRTWTHYILHREGTDFMFHYQLLFYYYKNVIYTGGIIINILISRISKICTYVICNTKALIVNWLRITYMYYLFNASEWMNLHKFCIMN